MALVVADISDQAARWIGYSILTLILVALVGLVLWGLVLRRRR